jgi:glutathione S-transferase
VPHFSLLLREVGLPVKAELEPTMTDKTKSVITSDDAVVAEIQISAPPDRVFQALTDPAQLMLWFNNASCPVKFWEIDARPGGRYLYETRKGSVVVNNVSEFKCHGEILEIDPPRLLVYTWIASWHGDKSRRTIVRWELSPEGNGTRVKVTHSGLADESAARKDYAGGWPGVLENLKTFTEK